MSLRMTTTPTTTLACLLALMLVATGCAPGSAPTGTNDTIAPTGEQPATPRVPRPSHVPGALHSAFESATNVSVMSLNPSPLSMRADANGAPPRVPVFEGYEV